MLISFCQFLMANSQNKEEQRKNKFKKAWKGTKRWGDELAKSRGDKYEGNKLLKQKKATHL